MKTVKFKQIPVGTIFMCDKGKFKKVRKGSSIYEGNVIQIPFGTPGNINGNTFCKVDDDVVIEEN